MGHPIFRVGCQRSDDIDDISLQLKCDLAQISSHDCFEVEADRYSFSVTDGEPTPNLGMQQQVSQLSKLKVRWQELGTGNNTLRFRI